MMKQYPFFRKAALLVFTLCVASVGLYAQSRDVKGTVVDAATSQPIVGANVLVKNTTTGTFTDADGQFTVKAKPDDVLVFSCVGYTGVQKTADVTSMTVTLKEDLKGLEEVVVVGYGIQKKANLTGAVAAIDGKTLAAKQSQNVFGALQGELPGIAITRGSGQPGNEEYGIRIRGFSSANPTATLVLIDGVEGDLALVNPDDIASISVLKDAAAASIYGARAAAGVVLVTTKTSKEGKAKITYNGYYGVNTPGNMPERLPAWEEQKMINEGRINQGGAPEWNAEMTEWISNPNFNYRPNNSNGRWDYFSNTDWIAAGTNKYASQQNHSLSVAAGDKKLNYLLSTGYYTRNGILKYGPDSNDRYNIRLKVNSEINNYIDLGIMASYQGSFVENNPFGANNILDRLYRIRVRQPIFTPEEDTNTNPYNGDLAVNPIDLLINGGVAKTRYEDFVGKGNITIKNLIKGLRFNASLSRSADFFSSESQRRNLVWYDRLGTTVRFQANNPNSLAKTKNNAYHDVAQFTADYDLKVGDHTIHALAGTSYENYRKDQISATASNLNSNDFFSFNYYDSSVATNTVLHDSIATWSMSSYFGRFNYNYKEKYLFEANVRYDGSSRLAPENRWQAFPSFSAAWRVNDEEFFDVPAISNLKIRGSWGQLGNGAVLGLYQYMPLITSGRNMTDCFFFQQDLASTKKTWETIETTDLGMDLGLLNNRLTVTADYYWKYNNNMLARIQVPSLIGIGVPFDNIGQLKTWGWEFDIKWADKINDFNYSVAFNISDSQNKLLKYNGINTISDGTVNLLEGYPLNTIWGYKTDGYWASKEEYTAYKTANPGYKSFSDATVSGGDVKYVAQGAADHEIGSGGGTPEKPGDLVNLGSTNGRYLFGLNLSASYKGFDFGVFFQGVGKRSFLIDVQTLAPFFSTSNMPWTIHRDYWTPDNQDAFWPRLYNYSGNDLNFKTSDKWIQDGAYIRLKNIQLGYTVPIKKKYIENLRIYVSGNDVWEYSNVLSVFDPEAENAVGADYYPFFRTWATGVSITF